MVVRADRVLVWAEDGVMETRKKTFSFGFNTSSKRMLVESIVLGREYGSINWAMLRLVGVP